MSPRGREAKWGNGSSKCARQDSRRFASVASSVRRQPFVQLSAPRLEPVTSCSERQLDLPSQSGKSSDFGAFDHDLPGIGRGKSSATRRSPLSPFAGPPLATGLTLLNSTLNGPGCGARGCPRPNPQTGREARRGRHRPRSPGGGSPQRRHGQSALRRRSHRSSHLRRRGRRALRRLAGRRVHPGTQGGTRGSDRRPQRRLADADALTISPA